jgi:hypothetical protein
MTKEQHFADVVLKTAKTALVAYPVLIAGLANQDVSNAFILKLTAFVAAGTAVLNIGIKLYNAATGENNTPVKYDSEDDNLTSIS